MGQRPDHLKAPAYLSKSPPLPAPAGEPTRKPAEQPQGAGDAPEMLDPTRYGDWEHKGIAEDF